MIHRTAWVWIAPLAGLLMASAHESGGPHYLPDGALAVPADYREWVFLSAGLDMSYSDAPSMAGHSMFDNVFVDRASWQVFKDTGHWPDQTLLVLEHRSATVRGSINRHGKYQSGEPMGIEIHVRDTGRFKGGWAFFEADGTAAARQVPDSADCYSCHLNHGAVDTTFVQFYPTAQVIAGRAGTLRSAASIRPAVPR